MHATTIQTLGIALGSSWTAGINLYAMCATLGLLGRFGSLELPGELGVLTSWWLIGISSALYCVEFIADKIPLVDSIWDVVHTFIRVPAGAVVAAAALGDVSPEVQVGAFLIGGTLALGSHATKSSARVLLNTSPEPATNIVASVAEDALAVCTVALAYFLPIVAMVIVIAGTVATIVLLPRILRLLRKALATAITPFRWLVRKTFRRAAVSTPTDSSTAAVADD